MPESMSVPALGTEGTGVGTLSMVIVGLRSSGWSVVHGTLSVIQGCHSTTLDAIPILEARNDSFRRRKLKHAEEEGWRVEVGGGHAWGKIYCLQ